MRILIISTIYNTTPPRGYGGIQRVVHYLTEALAALGHEIVLLAPPKSWCTGRTIEVDAYDPDRQWMEIKSEKDMLSEEPLYEATRELLEKESFDIIHDWSFQNLFVRRHPKAAPFIISTCIPPSPGFKRSNLVACSAAHAKLCGESTKFVHYGLPLEDWPYNFDKSNRLVHIAKLARYKGQHLTILAALLSGRELDIAGNIEQAKYAKYIVSPLASLSSNIARVGELNGTTEFLLNAKALVQAPRWFDAFPLVVLESLATGTPVIGLAAGGVPEQISHGKTGFLCHNLAELTKAFKRIDQIKPEDCRQYAEEHFHSRRMAEDYLNLYKCRIEGSSW